MSTILRVDVKLEGGKGRWRKERQKRGGLKLGGGDQNELSTETRSNNPKQRINDSSFCLKLICVLEINVLDRNEWTGHHLCSVDNLYKMH